MKLTAVFLLAATLQVGARSMGQTMTASFKNTALTEVFKEVEKQTGFSFVFAGVQLQKAARITATLSDATLQQALKQIFKDQPLTYAISGRFIVVQQKAASLQAIDSLLAAFLPPGSVKGKVTDEAGKPVAGASVQVKGSKRSTFTNEQGEFMLNDIDPNATLVISAINIETREVPLKGRTEVTLVTVAKIYALEEVSIGVVNSGYQTISKERAAGSYGVVTAKELAQTPTISLLDRMEGWVPGVKVGIKSNTIQVRSSNTYAINSAPLIVIDGFPQVALGDVQSLTKIQSNQSANNALFSYVNPDDIEQITFLKDATATSIWGARGANGVIVIETKKGKRAAPVVSFTSSVGTSRAADLSKLKWMNSAEYINLEQELVDKKFLADPASATGTTALYTANNSEATEWMYKYIRGTATLAERDAALAAIAGRNNQEQIKDYLLQQALNQQYSLSVSGGGENSTYYVSGNYTKDRPVFKSNEAKSASFTANITSDFFKKKVTFRSGINYLYARNNSNMAAVDALSVSTTALRPYDMLTDANGNTIKRDVVMRPDIAAGLVTKGYLPFSYNAVDELNYSNTVTKENRVRLTTGLNIKMADWINLDLSGMIQQYAQNQNSINELNSYSSRLLVNTGTSIVSNKMVYGVPYGGTYTLYDLSGYDYSLRSQLNFNKRFKQDHQVVALAGVEIRETYNKGYGSTRYGYNSDVNTAATINPTVAYTTMYGWTQTLSDPLTSLSEKKSRYLSYLSNLSYTYKEKYIVTGSMRFDDYTLQGLDRKNRAAPLWSAGLRWNAAKENFLKKVSFLDDLSARLTLGTGGSVPLAGTNVTVISVSGTDSRTGQPVASIQTPANTELGWELTKTLNGGIGFGLFHGRLSGSVDMYKKWSSGIIYSLPFNATYGWSNVSFNSASLTSHGIDIGITGQLIRKKDLTWSSTLNFAYAMGKVTDSRFTNTASSLISASAAVEGLPMGYQFVYRWAGLSATGQSQIYDRNKNVIASTTNLPATFTREDLKYAGVTVAPYFGGYFNNIRYKSFELGVQVTYYLGHIFLKQSIDNYPYYTGYAGVLSRNKDLASRWQKAGDENTTNVPGLTNISFNSINRYKYADIMVEKADNIRLQQVSLSYRVPQELLPKGVFKSLSVSANARNLGLIWTANKQGLDPEYLNSGNYSNLPPATSFVFSLNASF